MSHVSYDLSDWKNNSMENKFIIIMHIIWCKLAYFLCNVPSEIQNKLLEASPQEFHVPVPTGAS